MTFEDFEKYKLDHGLSDGILNAFQIDYDPSKKRIIIPIKDIDGNFLFNKYRHLDFDKNNPNTKKFSYDPGSHATLFNLVSIKDSPYVVIAEGEPDVMRLFQEGIVAVCSTSGAATFKKEWVKLLEGKKIYIVYDSDGAGINGTKSLAKHFPEALIIELPKETKDICEYFLLHSKDEFKKLCQEAKPTKEYLETNDIQNKDSELLIGGVKPILLSDLEAENYEVDWIWEGYLALSHLTLLSAYWKAGKTTLISLLIKAIQSETSFAGQTTRPCKILVISEESKHKWVERREDFQLDLPVYVVPRPITQRLKYDEWINLINQTETYCKKEGIELVIIDTLSKFWSVIKEGDAPEVDGALLPINKLLESNIAVLLVHHFKKGGGEEGTAARGSGSLAATADILVDFSRLDAKNPQSKQRVLKSLSRFDETPIEVVLDLVDGEYKVLGTKSDVEKRNKIQQILIRIPFSPDAISINNLLEDWDETESGNKPSRRTAQRYINILIKNEDVFKTEAGKTPKYSRVKDIPYANATVVTQTNARHDSGNPLELFDEKEVAK